MDFDAQGSFRCHANYIRAFAMLCGQAPVARTRLPSLQTRFGACTALSDTKTKGIDLAQIRKSLVKAWVTELLLGLTGQYVKDDDVLRMTNNWSVVQAYYAFYHVTQALGLAKGQPRFTDHQKTQNLFLDCWVRRPARLDPWTLGASADGINVPPGTIETVSPLVRCTKHTCLSFAAMALRTTREQALKRAYQKRRREKQKERRKAWQVRQDARTEKGWTPLKRPRFGWPQLTLAEKTKMDTGLRPYSLMDYLYRLRIKTHYVDAGMFIEGPDDDQLSRRVYMDLRWIVSATMLVSETRIITIVGSQLFSRWAHQWAERLPPAIAFGLRARLPFLVEP